MLEHIWRDAQKRPDLFVWYGPPNPEALSAWLVRKSLSMPSDLLELWLRTGGGDFLETETILGPLDVPSWGDSLDEVWQSLKLRGLSEVHVPIHLGRALTALNTSTGLFDVLDDESFVVARTYQSIDDWYRDEIRNELASIYGL